MLPVIPNKRFVLVRDAVFDPKPDYNILYKCHCCSVWWLNVKSCVENTNTAWKLKRDKLPSRRTVSVVNESVCVFSDPNSEALRLVHELKLRETVPMVRMFRGGQPKSLSHRVFALTCDTFCGFWQWPLHNGRWALSLWHIDYFCFNFDNMECAIVHGTGPFPENLRAPRLAHAFLAPKYT